MKNYLVIHKPDFFSIVETWLDSDIDDKELYVEGYVFFRRDRGSRGGGLLFYFKNEHKCTWKTGLAPISDIFNEIMVTEVHLKNCEKLYIVLFYRPPNADETFNNNMNFTLEKITALSPMAKICMIGDLNMPSIQWDELAGNSALTNSLCNTLNEFNMVQINNLPSRENNNNILDVVMNNFYEHETNISSEVPVFNSDHHMFTFFCYSYGNNQN